MKRLSDSIASRFGARAIERFESTADSNAVAADAGVILTSRARVVKSSWISVLREDVLTLTPDRLLFRLNETKLDAPVSALSDVRMQESRQKQGFSFKVNGQEYNCSFDRLSSPSVAGSLLATGSLPPEISQAIRTNGTRTEVFSSYALCSLWVFALEQVIGNPGQA